MVNNFRTFGTDCSSADNAFYSIRKGVSDTLDILTHITDTSWLTFAFPRFQIYQLFVNLQTKLVLWFANISTIKLRN